MHLAHVLLCLIVGAALLPAAVDPDPDRLAEYRRLCADQVDRLVTFATAGPGKAGSFDIEVREKALALARKIDPNSTKTRNVFAQHHAMSADEEMADRTMRAEALKRDASRKLNDAKADAPSTPPTAQDPGMEFENLKFRLLGEQIAFASAISLDPDNQEVVVIRQLALKNVLEWLPPVTWNYEKKLKIRVVALASAHYEPWTGSWVTDKWGVVDILQKDGKASASWAEGGKLSGEVKGRSLVGRWSSGRNRGTFQFTLGANDHSFEAHLTVEMTDPETWNATRKDVDAPSATTPATEPAGEQDKSGLAPASP
jgi:hypothetical protein